MSLIIILIALLLERLTPLGLHLKKLSGFDRYQLKIQEITANNGVVNLLLAVLPVIIVVWLVQIFLVGVAHGLFSWVFGLLVLMFSLGKSNLRSQVDDCLELVEQDKEEEAKEFFKEHFYSLPPEHGTAKELIAVIFKESHQRIFSVIFWFVLLGPVGAILYRLLHCLSAHFVVDHEDKSIYKIAVWCVSILDWIPVRLMALSFALIGHFDAVLPVWLKSLQPKLSINYESLSHCGNASLSLTDDPHSVVAQAQLDAAFTLVNRSLLVWLVVIALIVVL